MSEPLLECKFLIPVVRDSDRKTHGPLAWRLLQDNIGREFPKGHTGPEVFYKAVDLVPGEYKGKKSGKDVNDMNRQYIVAISEDKVDVLRGLLCKAAVTFKQETIYLSVAGKVEFVPAGTEGLCF